MPSGDLELHGHSNIFFPLVQTDVVPGRLQHPNTIFTRPWDDFIVHGVNDSKGTYYKMIKMATYCLGQFIRVNYGKLDKVMILESWLR